MGGEVEGCENEWVELIKLLSGNKVSRWHLYDLITLVEVATSEKYVSKTKSEKKKLKKKTNNNTWRLLLKVT